MDTDIILEDVGSGAEKGTILRQFFGALSAIWRRMPKWIRFDKQETPVKRKTDFWNVICIKSGALLGTIRWYASWRKYAFLPEWLMPLVFEEDCLRDIAEFIESETKKYRSLRG